MSEDMTIIQSITLSYVAQEDRIHLAMLIKGGRTVRMWLTQRLARSLVTALRNHLEKTEGIPLPSVRNAVLAHEQANAVANIRATKPVTPQTDAPAYLVSNIELKLAAEQMGLSFASALDFKPGIVLEKMQMRQWLNMLYRQFCVGGWPQDVWPDWLIEGGARPASGATRH